MRILRSLSTAAALGLAATTCTTSDAVQPRTSAKSTHVLLTDGPFPYDRIARVDLYVVSVSASPNRRINVLALQNGATDELGTAALPTGVINAVRMVIDTDSSSITLKDGRKLTGSSSPGIDWQSSAGKPTLYALVHEQISVPDTGGIVVIDYDVGQAFVPPQEIDPASTDSGFVFSPVLRAVDATRTGSISGVVRAHTANGAPVVDASLRLYLGNPADPENTWSVLATAKSDATGAFKFAYVTRSAYWSTVSAQAGTTYIVAVDPPSNSGLGRALVANVVVTTGSDTGVGTVVLP
jgi:hypothetical protein